MDFDFAGLRQGARQTEHLRANRCLIYGQTVLHFESGLPLSWPPIWQPVESVEPVRAPSFPPSVPCPRRDRPGPRQGRVCTTTAPVLQPLVQREREAQPSSQNGRSLTRPAHPSFTPPVTPPPSTPYQAYPAAGRSAAYPSTSRARLYLGIALPCRLPRPLQGTPADSHQAPLPYSASWAQRVARHPLTNKPYKPQLRRPIYA